MIYVLSIMAVLAAGEAASPVALPSSDLIQLAQGKRDLHSWGKNYRVGRNGVITPKWSSMPKAQRRDQAIKRRKNRQIRVKPGGR